jgi:hypothetical protein
VQFKKAFIASVLKLALSSSVVMKSLTVNLI